MSISKLRRIAPVFVLNGTVVPYKEFRGALRCWWAERGVNFYEPKDVSSLAIRLADGRQYGIEKAVGRHSTLRYTLPTGEVVRVDFISEEYDGSEYENISYSRPSKGSSAAIWRRHLSERGCETTTRSFDREHHGFFFI